MLEINVSKFDPSTNIMTTLNNNFIMNNLLLIDIQKFVHSKYLNYISKWDRFEIDRDFIQEIEKFCITQQKLNGRISRFCVGIISTVSKNDYNLMIDLYDSHGDGYSLFISMNNNQQSNNNTGATTSAVPTPNASNRSKGWYDSSSTKTLNDYMK